MVKQQSITHPALCFGITRHHVIIPLKVVDVIDYCDGTFKYEFAINHPNPSDYLKCHHKADFQERFVSLANPLCDEFTNIRVTIEEAKELAIKKLKSDRDSAMAKVEAVDNRLIQMNADITEIKASIAQ